jgi:hypothetical protein
VIGKAFDFEGPPKPRIHKNSHGQKQPGIFPFIFGKTGGKTTLRLSGDHHPQSATVGIQIHGPKPYKCIGFGDILGPKPCKFTGFGDIHGPKPYKPLRLSGGPLGPSLFQKEIKDILIKIKEGFKMLSTAGNGGIGRPAERTP